VVIRRVLLMVLLLAGAQAWGQSYPTKTVKVIVPYGVGGPADIYGRFLSTKLQEALGHPFVVEDRPGGGSIVGTDVVAKSAPDGYTLLVMSNTHTVNETLIPKKPFDLMRDFAPITGINSSDLLMVIHPSVPAANLREFIALAKKQPGKLNYGSAGNGSAGHLAMEYLKLVAGIDLQHVPYKGTGPNLIDLVAGRTQATSAGTPPLMPHVKSGKLRVIAVGTPTRLHSLPEVPTVAEQGYPGFETSQWYGLNAPAKTPPAIIQRLAQEAAKAAKSPALLQRYAADDAESIGSTPQEYADFIAKEQARWKDVIQKAGVKAD